MISGYLSKFYDGITPRLSPLGRLPMATEESSSSKVWHPLHPASSCFLHSSHRTPPPSSISVHIPAPPSENRLCLLSPNLLKSLPSSKTQFDCLLLREVCLTMLCVWEQLSHPAPSIRHHLALLSASQQITETKTPGILVSETAMGEGSSPWAPETALGLPGPAQTTAPGGSEDNETRGGRWPMFFGHLLHARD